jgi:uncharacterized PurR-regulated membrane protein YhhQ (DUF165 family)
MMEEAGSEEELMKNLVGTVIAILLSAITCGATFLFALYRQLAMVEVAASLATGAELYFLSSSIGDVIEKNLEANKVRLRVAVGLAAAVVCYFLIAKHMSQANDR